MFWIRIAREANLAHIPENYARPGNLAQTDSVTSQIVLFNALHVEDPSVRFTPESGHWAKLAQKGR